MRNFSTNEWKKQILASKSKKLRKQESTKNARDRKKKRMKEDSQKHKRERNERKN